MDNTRIRIADLSSEAKKELNELVDNKENAFDMLLNNHSGKKEVSPEQVVARMQMQYFAKKPLAGELRTNDNNGWEQMEYYEPNEVNTNLASVSVNEEENSLYSSFALKEVDGVYSLRYPLDHSFAVAKESFAADQMPDYEYNRLLRRLERYLKIKVREDNVYTHSTYKANFFTNAIIKIKNAFFKLTKNYDKIQVGYSGCIKLHNKQGNYKISNVEKVVKIYDSIFGATIKKQAYLMKKQDDAYITKDITFASRIYANLLMARVTNFGNPEINKKVEKSLALQFANILNRGDFLPEDLKTITELATRTAADACKSMKITTQQIMARMNLNGYDYSRVPSNEFEALLYYKERDYSQYKTNFAKRKTTKKDIEPIVEPVAEPAPVIDSEPMKIAEPVAEPIAEPVGVSSNPPKYSDKKPLSGWKKIIDKIKNIGKPKNEEPEAVEEEITAITPVHGYQPGDPLYISYESLVKDHKQPQPKKKFSDLKIIRGLKKFINRQIGIYKLRTGEISKFDYDEFIEEAKGFGFIRNGVAHEKTKPEYNKVTKDQIQYVLDVQSGYYLPAPKPVLQLEAPKPVLQLEAAPQYPMLPPAPDKELEKLGEELGLIEEPDITLDDINIAENVKDNITDDAPITEENAEDNKIGDVHGAEEVKDVVEIADGIVHIEENDNNEESKVKALSEGIVKKTFADKVIRGKIIATPEGNVASISKEQIQKLIDKAIEDYLKDISVKVDNAIASKQYYKFGGKKHCENIRDLCLSTARYYAMHASNKATKKIKTDNPTGTIDGMAKFACGMLLEERNNIVTDILEGQEANGPERKVSNTNRYENIDTVVNRMFRKYKGYHIFKGQPTDSKVGKFIDEDTIKSHFKVFIKKLMVEYGKLTKKETSTNK